MTFGSIAITFIEPTFGSISTAYKFSLALALARIFSVHSCQNLIPCFLTFCSTVLVDPFDPYHHLNLVYQLFIGHYNNHLGAYIAGTQNYTGAYIIMASL